MKLIAEIDKALADMNAGKFTGNVVALLDKSKTALAAKQKIDEEVTLRKHREVLRQFHEYVKRLTEIATALIQARSGNAADIKVVEWSVLGDRPNPVSAVQRLSARVSWKFYQGPEFDEAEANGRLEGTGYDGDSYASRFDHLYFPTEWFWSDGWKEEAAKLAEEQALAKAEQVVKQIGIRLSGLETQYAELEKKRIAAVRHLEQLQKKETGTER